MSFDAQPIDLDRLVAEMARLGRDLEPAIGEALVADLKEKVLPASKELVPVDTGRLRDSGFVEGPEIGGGSASAEIGYDTPYATKQHEDLSLNHPHGGTSKFLEMPLHQWAEGAAERVIRRALESLG
jgi:hypothetical protein